MSTHEERRAEANGHKAKVTGDRAGWQALLDALTDAVDREAEHDDVGHGVEAFGDHRPDVVSLTPLTASDRPRHSTRTLTVEVTGPCQPCGVRACRLLNARVVEPAIASSGPRVRLRSARAWAQYPHARARDKADATQKGARDTRQSIGIRLGRGSSGLETVKPHHMSRSSGPQRFTRDRRLPWGRVANRQSAPTSIAAVLPANTVGRPADPPDAPTPTRKRANADIVVLARPDGARRSQHTSAHAAARAPSAPRALVVKQRRGRRRGPSSASVRPALGRQRR